MPSHPVDVHVGKKLRLRRTILGLSQESIGKATGVTFQQIQKYERGVNRMGSSRLYQFSKLMNVPIAYFFEDFSDTSEKEKQGSARYGKAAENAAPKFEHENITSRETLELMRAYYRITDPQVRKRVADLIKSLADPK